MRIFVSYLLALLVAAGVTSARAADIRDTGVFSAAQSAGAVNWTGFYIGGQIGYGNANHNLSVIEKHDRYCFDQFGNQLSGDPAVNSTVAPEDSFNPFVNKWDAPFAFNAEGTCENTPATETSPALGGVFADDSIPVDVASREAASLDGLNSHGIIGGGRLGFDYAAGRFLFGVYGSYDFSGMESSGSVGDFASFSVDKGDEWSLGARAGVVAGNRTLLYILAAYAQTEYEFAGRLGDDAASRDIEFNGVTVGGGIEYALSSNIFLGLEYQHTFYGEETIARANLDTGLPGHRLELRDDLDEDKIMATIKFKTGGLDQLF